VCKNEDKVNRVCKKNLSVVAVVLLLVFIGIGVFLQAESIVLGKNDYGIDKVSDVSQAESEAFFHGERIEVPKTIAEAEEESLILGEESNGGEKVIRVDLKQQRLYAYEGDRLVYSFLISSGKWGRTPTGEFQIWGKFRYTKMEGGSKALRTYYYLPNVPYVMFFANNEIAKSRGFSIHGTYWHNNFGVPMSHGCINMKTEEVALLYQWAQPKLFDKKSILASGENPGTKVVIYGAYKDKGG
jgi:hypothetical protein